MVTQKIKKILVFLSFVFLALILNTSCASKATLDTDYELNLKFGNELAKGSLWKEAIIRWENGLKMKPNDARFHNNLAIAYENEGNYEKAEYHYKKAIQLNPTNEIIQMNWESFQGVLKNIKSTEDDKTEGNSDDKK
ncbi:MAG: tetratricopeptide repeat protein [Acidobacteria bacterium]|nr:tetratricopeptide repeat protein [Acidobacteriota bacterium]